MAVQIFENFPDLRLKKKRELKSWIRDCVEREGKKCGTITILIERDEEVHKINKQYLDHDWLTDVIAFDYNEGSVVNGDIVISAERVRENAKTYREEEEEEMRRVMIHGVLHLIGYEDDTPEKKREMRKKEDEYLKRWKKKEKKDGRV